MLVALQVLCLLLLAVAMGLALAHALEWPGKIRLPKDDYFHVQTIYYPGFVIGGGFGEAGGLLALIALTVATPAASAAFWLTLGAFVALGMTHTVFWLITQPINKIWLKDLQLGRAGARFFGRDGDLATGKAADWTRLRDRWEYSHAARAVLALLSLALLATAIAVGPGA
jgi:hypothetical protein